MTWQVNTARNHLSELLQEADTAGPQIITHHGKARSVVLSIDAYRELEELKPAKPDFISYLLSIPKGEFEDFEIERDHSVHDREIDL